MFGYYNITIIIPIVLAKFFRCSHYMMVNLGSSNLREWKRNMGYWCTAW